MSFLIFATASFPRFCVLLLFKNHQLPPYPWGPILTEVSGAGGGGLRAGIGGGGVADPLLISVEGFGENRIASTY